MTVGDIICENERRLAANNSPYDPVGGDPADSGRVAFSVDGIEGSPLNIPATMAHDPLVASLMKAGSVAAYLRGRGEKVCPEMKEIINRRFVRVRILHDFPYWAASFVYIKKKGGGGESLFVLNRPQRRLVAALEEMRRGNLPIRLILLKARQWGGSTCVQLYMAWLQMVHQKCLNSLIIAHQGLATDEIKEMFDRMLANYPDWLLHEEGEEPPKGRRMENGGCSRGAFRVVSRNCKVKLGNAERPDSCRGGDYNLVHCSEVGIWRATRRLTPEQIMRSACSGVLLAPMTMIVLESTANGTGNFFHREYESARAGESQFRPLFISWYDIDQYSLPVDNPEEFARALLEGKEETVATSSRRQPGAYLWWP